jgi:hypothetical protein
MLTSPHVQYKCFQPHPIRATQIFRVCMPTEGQLIAFGLTRIGNVYSHRLISSLYSDRPFVCSSLDLQSVV